MHKNLKRLRNLLLTFWKKIMVLVRILTAFQRFPFKPVILNMATSTWLTSEQKVLYIVRAATFLIFQCSFKAAHIHLSITCHCCMHKFIQLIFSSLNYILRLIFAMFYHATWTVSHGYISSFSQLATSVDLLITFNFAFYKASNFT